MNEASAISRPGAGRPTREQAEARHAELLDHALDHFLDKGFEQATIEAIAADVGMTKRTVYARYPDKASLFRAAVSRAIERYAIPEDRIHATEIPGDLAQTLTNIAMLRIDLVSSPQGLKLQRIIQTESYRFPEIFTDTYEIGALPTIKFLAKLLRRETEAGNLAVEDTFTAANAFISMVVTGPVKLILAAIPLPTEELDRRIAFGVDLFLNGARPR
ncbi:MAG: TetR/AcrR family transcriptional regulator [Novosphingobium sp.]|nr:MAG: TetR/AcrR family transcriptional regulator [Novosphingobium sp.]